MESILSKIEENSTFSFTFKLVLTYFLLSDLILNTKSADLLRYKFCQFFNLAVVKTDVSLLRIAVHKGSYAKQNFNISNIYSKLRNRKEIRYRYATELKLISVSLTFTVNILRVPILSLVPVPSNLFLKLSESLTSILCARFGQLTISPGRQNTQIPT